MMEESTFNATTTPETPVEMTRTRCLEILSLEADRLHRSGAKRAAKAVRNAALVLRTSNA